mmetsp:Transcript_2452/g.7374  ORF Transcript_2452/g.7374 Transcript_2452/m.7374 type:complete len:235 (-) Transcript_2452:714-1418(-)
MTNGHHSSLHINVSCTAWLPLDRTLPVDYCSAHPQPCVHLVCFTRLIGGKGKRPQPQGTASGIRTLKASSEQGATIAVYITCTGSPGRRKRSKGTKGARVVPLIPLQQQKPTTVSESEPKAAAKATARAAHSPSTTTPQSSQRPEGKHLQQPTATATVQLKVDTKPVALPVGPEVVEAPAVTAATLPASTPAPSVKEVAKLAKSAAKAAAKERRQERWQRIKWTTGALFALLLS